MCFNRVLFAVPYPPFYLHFDLFWSWHTKQRCCTYYFSVFVVVIVFFFFIPSYEVSFQLNSLEVLINSYFFSDYIKNKYKHTKSLTAASDYPQGNRTCDVIYMTKKNHSQGTSIVHYKAFIKSSCLWL